MSSGNRYYRLLDLVVDLQRQTVVRDGVAIELPDLSFKLLATLLAYAPETLGKDELIREVWGEVVVSDETLSQRVRLLRQALGEDGQEPRYIAAVRGRGYRLICAATPFESGADKGAGKVNWPMWAATAAVIIVALWTLLPGMGGGPTVRSIAVLPFADLSPQQDHQYFADGMQEELLSRLAGLENLSIVSRTSVERFRSSEQSLPSIAAELGVDAVIESSVRVAEDRVRITLQLIDAATDRHLWAETYDRELSVANIFAIQQDVADRVAKALELEYTTDNALLPTNNLSAYNDYLIGRYHTFRQTPEDLDLAIGYLNQAVTEDPEFAEAWSTLGWAYSFIGTIYGREPPSEVYPKAKDAVTRALAIDDQLSDAHTLYADILTWYDWDFAAAEEEYERTLELNPLNVLGYVLFLSAQLRHDEAISLIERRIAAQPNDPYVRINAGWAYLRAHQYEQAAEMANLAPQHTDALSVLGYAYLGLGEIERALALFETDLALQGRRPRQLSHLAVAYFKAGREAEGRALLTELEAAAEERYLSPDLLADVYFAAGDADSGFASLFEAIKQRARGVIFMQNNQLLKGYRSDPRYRIALRAVGL